MSIETFLGLLEDKRNTIIKNGLTEFSSKNYQDANTDVVVKNCGISKGSLYHYFGSKKAFYLYLLQHSLLLVYDKESVEQKSETDFYDTIFHSLSAKFKLHELYPLEFAFITVAAKEHSAEVFSEKQEILSVYMKKAQLKAYTTLQTAVSRLDIKENIDNSLLLRGLHIYVNAITMGSLERYKDNPSEFFENSETIKSETKSYIDMFLYGIVREE